MTFLNEQRLFNKKTSQNCSIETILNSSFPRLLYQEEEKRNRRLSNVINSHLSLPSLNNSLGSIQRSPRFSQTNDQFGTGLLLTRSLRRKTNCQQSLKLSLRAKKAIQSSSDLNQSNSKSNRDLLNNSKDHLNQIRFPMKPSEALRYFGDQLTSFERNEIINYNQIYYLGLEANKIVARNCQDYDDENGFYQKKRQDQICYRFEICQKLGKGSFGLVLRCYDHQFKEYCALKIIRNEKRFEEQSLIEIKILKSLKSFDSSQTSNIVQMKEYFYFRSHLCITFELLGINLFQLIEKNAHQGFSIQLIKRFAKSILKSLQIMAKQSIIHCDLKPENILLKEKGSSKIKIIDFGSGCFQSEIVYNYIQSRYYRAPEVILGISYTTAIDIWSFACIIVELFTGHPLFPGQNEEEQLAMFSEIIGFPPNQFLECGTRTQIFFDSNGMLKSSTRKKREKHRPSNRSLEGILRTNDHNFIDFIRQCLQWNPSQRLTPEQGLNHPWIIQRKSPKRYEQSINDRID